MSFLEFFDKLIRDPPLWFPVVLIPIVVAKVLTHITTNLTKLQNQWGLVEYVEMFMIIVLATFTFETAYLDIIKGSISHDWYENWFGLLMILLIYSIASLAAYIVYIKLTKVIK